MLKVENLSFLYDRKIVLDYVTLDFKPNHIYALIGENGAGKSTLLKCLANILEPNKGLVTYYGDVLKNNNHYLRNLFFLDEASIFEGLSIKHLAKLIAKLKEMVLDEAKFNEYLTIFNLSGTKPLISMSKGSKKIVYLIIMLCLDCKVIILDEYLDGIDLINRLKIKELLKEYAKNDEVIIIMASHSTSDIKDICDRVILLDNAIVKRNITIEQMHDLYKSYQLVLKENLNIDDLRLKGLQIQNYQAFENIRWISIPNEPAQIELLNKLDLIDLKSVDTTIDEVIYNELGD